MTEQAQKTQRAPWILAGVLLVALIVSLLAVAALAAGRRLAAHGPGDDEGGEDQFPKLVETWSHGKGDAKVARIGVDGIIMRGLSGGGLLGGGEDMVESVLRQIRAATNDEDVRGILLEVDSPGGAVTPSDEIYDALKRFRASDPGRKVVVFVRDMAASGGYYVSMASDRIVAEPTAILGSIGVIMESVNWNVLTQKIGIDATTIKSGENKDLLNPFRPVDPDHVRILQDMIDQIHGRFRSIVAEGRKLDAARVKELADGSVFSADVAKANGLIDEIGYWEEAVAAMTVQLGVGDVRVIRYSSDGSLFDRLFAVRAPGILGRLARMEGPRPMFLWRP